MFFKTRSSRCLGLLIQFVKEALAKTQCIGICIKSHIPSRMYQALLVFFKQETGCFCR